MDYSKIYLAEEFTKVNMAKISFRAKKVVKCDILGYKLILGV